MSHKRKILMAMAFLIIIKGIFKYHFKPIGQEGLSAENSYLSV